MTSANRMRQTSKDCSKTSFEVVHHAVLLLSVEYPSYDWCTISCFTTSCKVEIHSDSCAFYGHDTTTTVSGSRQPGSCNQNRQHRPEFLGGCHNTVPAMFKMDQRASFSTNGGAMGAMRQLLGDLLPTVGYTSYKHSTMKSL